MDTRRLKFDKMRTKKPEIIQKYKDYFKCLVIAHNAIVRTLVAIPSPVHTNLFNVISPRTGLFT